MILVSARTQRVLVLLIGAAKTPAELNDGYGRTFNRHYSGKRPGEAAIVEALETLRRLGDAAQDDAGRWTLTASGEQSWDALEAKHDSSGGYGDYGF